MSNVLKHPEHPRFASLTVQLNTSDDQDIATTVIIDANNPDAAIVTSGSQASGVTRWMTTGFTLPFTTHSTIRYATGLEHILFLLTTSIDDVTSPMPPTPTSW